MGQEQKFGDDQNSPKGEFAGYVPSEDSDFKQRFIAKVMTGCRGSCTRARLMR